MSAPGAGPGSLAARFLLFCLLPQGFQFLHGYLLRGASRGAQLLLHPLKPSPEFAVGFSQRRFRIEREIACDGPQHEKKVSDFAFQALAQIVADFRLARPRDATALGPGTGRGKFFEMLPKLRGLLAKLFE